MQAALAWLRLAVAPSEVPQGSDIASAVRRPARGLSPRVVEWMSEQRTNAGLERLAARLGARDGEKIRGFLRDLHTVRRSAVHGSTAAVLRLVRDVIGLDAAMQLLETSRRRLVRSAQTDDLDALVALAALHPDPGGFETWLRKSLGQPGSADGVMLATIHSVKGREWPHVVLHDVSAGLMPHRLAVDVEEERRIFHVGLTRASASVHVVAGDPPSPFLAELAERWSPARPPVREGRLYDAPQQPRRDKGRTRVTSTAPPRRPEKEDPELVPRIGLEFEYGGHRMQVVTVGDDGVVAAVGRARMLVAYGEMVRANGGLSRLAAEPQPPEVVERAQDSLRAWRSGRAAAEGKPAFVFLHDRTIEALATSLPTTMKTLAMVKGIGPAKLEAYGEELLALLIAARDGA